MTREIAGIDTVLILKEHNKWRRGHQKNLPHSVTVLGEAIDAVVKELVKLRKIEDAARDLKRAKTHAASAAAFDDLMRVVK